MKIKTNFVIIAMLILGCSYAQKVSVIHVTQGVEPDGSGYFYYLPKTIFEVEVTMMKTEKYKGPYSRFAEKYFGKENYIKADSKEYKLARVEVRPITVPDPEQLYFVHTEKAMNLTLQTNNDGIILGINPEMAERDFKRNVQSQKKAIMIPENRKFAPILNYAYKNDTIINREYTRDSTVIERRSIKKIMVEKSPEEGAKDAIEKIQQIRANKYTLITAPEDISVDGNGLKFMVSELDKMEQDYLQMFLGYSFKYESKIKFLYDPKPGTDRNMFNFTPEKGVYFNKDINGIESVKFELNINNDQRNLKDFYVKVLSEDERANLKQIRYRIPLSGTIKMSIDGEVLYENTFSLPQFGTLCGIALKNMESTELDFDENTGNIIKIEFSK